MLDLGVSGAMRKETDVVSMVLVAHWIGVLVVVCYVTVGTFTQHGLCFTMTGTLRSLDSDSYVRDLSLTGT
jgi:hypothetical protein